MNIGSIGSQLPISDKITSTGGQKNEETVGKVFSDFLKEAMNKTTELSNESTKLTNDFAVGKTDNLHEVMIAAEKADVALQYTMQIRNKIMDAYNEIMRMQI